MDVIHYPDDRRPKRLAPAGARAGQLRRPAPRPPEDRRARGPDGRRALGDAARADVRPAPDARRPARQGAAAADDDGAEGRGARAGRCAGPGRGRDSRPRWRRGTPRRSSASCWSSGCASPRSGWAPTSCSATTGPATSRCCACSVRGTASGRRRSTRCATRTSSCRARACARLISDGRVDEAATLLGRHYFMDGTVVHGLQRGRLLGFPTANLESENELTPPNGVYATLATLDGIVYPSVTNIGVRPTFHQPSATSSRPTCWTSSATCTARGCACRSCSGSATSGPSTASRR